MEELVVDWGELGHEVYWAHMIDDPPGADFCFCLSFGRIVPSATRALFGHTLVVHPSGTGYSPIRANIAGKPLKIRGEARSVGHFAAMLRAPQPVDLAFEAFLKELPPEYAKMAREFKAFACPRKLKTPAQWLPVVMLYCGLDQALRTTAGSFTRLEERLAYTAIHQRLRACGPWLKALLHRRLPATATPLSTLRRLIVDGSSRQGPGAEGTDDRVHLALD
ncbi:hypothetical protein [uncultured Thiocystis sp.]|uniref:hypothetical protein n=1 Tax=uncultured Thiocystis sp. TaxID=1202134 RepID=UPI0025F99EA7|nr:hypothetical protein [uncultured Thiocystis sp.]